MNIVNRRAGNESRHKRPNELTITICLEFEGETYYRKDASAGHYQMLYG